MALFGGYTDMMRAPRHMVIEAQLLIQGRSDHYLREERKQGNDARIQGRAPDNVQAEAPPPSFGGFDR